MRGVRERAVYGTSPIRRTRRTKAEIEALDLTLAEIVAHIRPATVRQVFYQAVNHGLVPKDESKGYRVVQRRLLALRESGVVPYGYIVDGTRYVHGGARYEDPSDFANYAAGVYRKDYWSASPVNVEVWVEKDALAGVLRPVVVDECGLGLYVTRGFPSVTYLHEAAQAIRHDGRPTYVYVLSDFDPSGVAIAAQVESELIKRAPDSEITVRRLALDREQVDRWELPTRPTKTNDSRARKFVAEHGYGSVELDAIPPRDLRRLVKDAIEQHMDPRELRTLKMVEEQEREGIKVVMESMA